MKFSQSLSGRLILPALLVCVVGCVNLFGQENAVERTAESSDTTVSTGVSSGNDAPNDTDDPGDAVHRWADEVASTFEIRSANSDQTHERIERSLIRWSNPIVGEVYGDCYLWVDGTRPSAFLSVFAFESSVDKRRLTFQSLSTESLKASRGERVVWQPDAPGIEWRPLSANSPAGSAGLRLVQMRRLAASYRAEISVDINQSELRRLRLLPKPIYRYGDDKSEVIDGALFAFVDGTDPELLLLIEVVEDAKGGKPKWMYAVARQNHRELKLSRNGIEVWSAEQIAPPWPNPNVSSPSGIYFNSKWLNFASPDEL